jgi:esterase/lipase
MREYWQWRYPAQAASLLRLKRMARHSLHRVTADTLIVAGGRDTSVPLSVIPLIEARIASEKKEHLIIAEGTHQILAGEGGERAVRAIEQWLAD